MSDEASDSATETLTAEFRDGQLQIVEVTPYEKNNDEVCCKVESEAVQDEEGAAEDGAKYMQVYDNTGKGLMQLDLLNLTLVRCEGEEDQFRLVTNAESSAAGGEFLDDENTTVTCVLQSSDGEENEGNESYVVVKTDDEQEADPSSYVMVEGDEGIMLLQSEPQTSSKKKEEEKPQTAYEILERSKALRKAKKLISESLQPHRGPGRRRKYELPEAQQMLSSPSFKLFLYSCKMCSFRCNAIRELTAHRTKEHASANVAKYRGGAPRAASALLQCARCPYRAASAPALARHAQDSHLRPLHTAGPATATTQPQKSSDAAIDEAAPDSILVCGACGFESASRPVFRAHIEDAHTAMMAGHWVIEDSK